MNPDVMMQALPPPPQVYDKGKEITEVSGKDWMIALWQRAGHYPPEGVPDAWRIEARFGKQYLKERNIRTPGEVDEWFAAVVSEALFTRRLTVEIPSDSNRRRWALHPMWSLAYQVAGADHMPPIGHRVTGRRDALSRMAKRQQARTFISLGVLEDRDWSVEAMDRKYAEVREMATTDREFDRKVKKAQERYSTVSEAR